MIGAQDLRMREMRDEISELKAIVQTITEKYEAQIQTDARTIHNLEEKVKYLESKLYNPSREKLPCEGQLTLDIFNEAEQLLPEITPEQLAEEKETVSSGKRPRKPRITNAEKFKNLPKEKVVYQVPEDQRICNVCGGPLTRIGEEYLFTELKFVPSRLIAVEYYAEKYRCDTCELKDGESHIFSAESAERVIPHSFASASLISECLYQKFVNCVPFYRQEKDWKQLGMAISRTDMAFWLIYAAREYFKPLYELIHRELIQRKFMMADETRVQVLKEDDRKPESVSYMWLYRSGEDGQPPLILYQYTETRAKKNPLAFLKGYSGYLMTDGYQGYDDLPGIRRCCCWAHVRRYFFDAVAKGQQADLSDPAVQGVLYCDKLFEYERQSREKGHTAEQRKKFRLDKEKPILTAFWTWLDRQNPDMDSKLGHAVQYARNRKPFLETYLEDGRCSLSNNLSENAIRPFTLGRKNWLFSDTPAGAESSAMVYTLVEMAKAYGLNVRSYLEYILEKRPTEKWTDEQLKELLPSCEAVKAACSVNKEAGS